MKLKLKQHRRATPIYRESGYLKKMKPLCKAEKIIWIAAPVVLLVVVALVLLARQNPGWVEKYYSLGFYPFWAGWLSTLTGLVPASLAELLLIAAVLCCIGALLVVVRLLVRNRRYRGTVLLRALMRLVAVAALLALLFTLGGGLNYYRASFTQYSGLTVRPSETQELAALCDELVQQANDLRVQLAEDAQGISVLATGGRALARQANDGYIALGSTNQSYNQLFALSQRVPAKAVFFSKAMSYMQIVGFFFPFTLEANINTDVVDFCIPNAMTHELAHISGFMREDEANFIAYLACRENPDAFFRYSGTMLALIHSTNALYSKDTQGYNQVMEKTSEGVRRDMTADSLYFQKYDTSFGDFSTAVNDVYLKVNAQTDGVASYGRMVDLLLADYRLRHDLT